MKLTEQLLTQGMLTLAMTSGWILIVLILRRPVSRLLGVRWAYRLWLLPLLSLLAGAIPGFVLYPLHQLLQLPLADITGIRAMIRVVVSEPIASPLLALWVAGMIISALKYAKQLFQQTKTLQLASHKPDQDERTLLLKQYARLPDLKRAEVRVFESNTGPALSGLLAPVLYLPANFFTHYDADQQRLMLQHEHLHFCRQDLRFLMLARLFRCVFWFNPLVWLAERRLQTDQELSCDEHVLHRASNATRRLYGETLIQTTQNPLGSVLVQYSAAFAQLLQRTLMLKKHRRRALTSLAGAMLFTTTCVFAVLGGLTASQTSPENIRNELGIALAELYGLLQCGEPDRLALKDILKKITDLSSSFQSLPLNAREIAQLQSLSGMTHQRLGNYVTSLDAYQQAARLVPDTRASSIHAHCNLAPLWNTPPTVSVAIADAGIRAAMVSPSASTQATRGNP